MTEDTSGNAPSSSGTTGADTARTISPTAVWAAVAVLVAFGGLVIWVLSRADTTNEIVWQREIYIYGSVEALVFAAAGALFGVQVKREQVAKAEQRATNSEAEAGEAKRSERAAASDAANGRAQAATIRGFAASAAAGGPAAGQGAQEDIPRAAGRAAGTGGMTSDTALAALRNVADELFPPMGGGSYSGTRAAQNPPGGESAAAAQAVTGVSPTSGPMAGGDTVTVTGRGFTGTTGVNFGTVAAPKLAIASDTQLFVTSPPAAAAGAVDVTVTTPAGTSATTPADQFTYT